MNPLIIYYGSFVKCHYQHALNPSPFTLLKDVQDWISRMPESDLSAKVMNAGHILYRLVYKGDLFVELSHTSDIEKQDLRLFAQFFIDFFARLETLNEPMELLPQHGERPLNILKTYLYQNPPSLS